ncbi:hypothetical protein Nepgr_009872 [Nepenthes gracilis]|uniref:Uncharacterized protein n=1 Tax=Nepenthes gracilis TaxID=150966 RepID=A0AAD3SBJ2_NEPGR|nr:hypothetical protein Nepgr_009872 [Nepenthes gracilis]
MDSSGGSSSESVSKQNWAVSLEKEEWDDRIAILTRKYDHRYLIVDRDQVYGNNEHMQELQEWGMKSGAAAASGLSFNMYRSSVSIMFAGTHNFGMCTAAEGKCRDLGNHCSIFIPLRATFQILAEKQLDPCCLVVCNCIFF